MSNELEKNPGCLGAILKIFGMSGPTVDKGPLPYGLRDDFLSPSELSFYHVLLSVSDESLTVCPKVNLNDIFFATGGDQKQVAKNKINRKHVDFLLCERSTMRPLAGVELDDSSHARADRQVRDGFVEQVFVTAKLPLLRFPAQRAYNTAEIAARISQALAGEPSPPAAPVAQDAPAVASDTPSIPQNSVDAPICPKCGIPLVIRSGRRGQFYGCPNYPKCRELVAIP